MARAAPRGVSSYARTESALGRTSSSTALPEATLLFLNAPAELRVNGAPVETRVVERYGFRFAGLLADLGPEGPVEVTGGEG